MRTSTFIIIRTPQIRYVSNIQCYNRFPINEFLHGDRSSSEVALVSRAPVLYKVETNRSRLLNDYNIERDDQWVVH